MAIFDEWSQKAKNVATITVNRAQDAVSLAKINVAIAGEHREIDKNCRTIGEWFVSEYSGEIPDAVRELVDAVHASRSKIEELEASKPTFSKEEEEPAPSKICPICGTVSNGKFCPECGEPLLDVEPVSEEAKEEPAPEESETASAETNAAPVEGASAVEDVSAPAEEAPADPE